MVNPGIGQEKLSEKIGNVVVCVSFNEGKTKKMLTKTEKNWAFKQQESRLIVGVCSLYALQLIAEYPDVWIGVGLGAVVVAIQSQKWLKIPKRWGYLLLGIILVPALINWWATPGSAEVLLTRVQQFFSSSFGGESYGSAIDLIFNSARGFYIMLLLIAAWQGWQSYQQQDEMGAFVRNMLYSLAVVFSVDVFSGFVVPT